MTHKYKGNQRVSMYDAKPQHRLNTVTKDIGDGEFMARGWGALLTYIDMAKQTQLNKEALGDWEEREGAKAI